MEVEIGRVTHYFNHINVAVITLRDSLKLGDKIHFYGHATDFTQRVNSIEVNHHSLVWVMPGKEVAIKVIEPVHEHDKVYRMIEGALQPA